MKTTKRKRWSIYTKPHAPFSPTKPKEFYTTTEFTEFFESSYDDVKLCDLALPENCSLNDVAVRTESHYDDPCIKFGIVKDVKIKNVHYEEQMRTYKECCKQHKLNLEEHRKEIKEWEQWCKDEKKKMLDDKLKKAEKLLKEYGRI